MLNLNPNDTLRYSILLLKLVITFGSYILYQKTNQTINSEEHYTLKDTISVVKTFTRN